MDYTIKLVSIAGKDCTIEVTYPDNSKKTMVLGGLPTTAETAQEFVAEAKRYMTAYLAGEQSAQVTPSTAVTNLVGQSTIITI